MTDEATATYRIVYAPNRALTYRAERRERNGDWLLIECAPSEQMARNIIAEYKRRFAHGEQERVIAYID